MLSPEDRLKQKNEFDGNLSVNVKQFNIKTGRDKHLNNRNQKNDQYVDSVTGLISEKLTIQRPCCVCGSNEEKLLFIKEGFRHVKCTLCGMVYVNPVLKPDLQHTFYEDEASYTQVLVSDLQASMDRKKSIYALEIIDQYLPRKGRLLDIGCGPGTFLKAAGEHNWEVKGIEFNKTCVDHLREDNIEVIDVPLERAQLSSNSYQCVSMWGVLEHILEPKLFLNIIQRILAPDGMLLINVPNINSLVNRILHEKSGTFSGGSHINMFSVFTLTKLLTDSGFEVRETETLLTEIGTINNYLNYEDPYFGNSDPVLDLLTPEYIHSNKLGKSVLALSSKPS